MPAILDDIVANKLAEVAARRTTTALADLEAKVLPAENQFLRALSDNSLKLVCELKPRSPSAGTLRDEVNVPEIIQVYSCFAAAISVLTDQKYFGGSLDLLSWVARNTSVPVLCKDFILDELQVLEARAAGAHAVLLIVKILTDAQLALLHTCIRRLGMTALVEVQNQQELQRCLRLLPEAILINNRDLATFEISFETTRTLAPQVPRETVVISASGINTRADIESLLDCTSKFLIGTSLMKSAKLTEKLIELTGGVPR